jgi:Protein of unknown function (DUF998)
MTMPTSPHSPQAMPFLPRGSARLALLSFAMFIALTILVHLLRPGLDPLRRTLSEYAIGSPYGFIFSLALLCLGAGSFALWNGLRLSLTGSRWSRVGLSLLLLWAIGTGMAGVFTTDPDGIPVSVNGVIHGLGASLAFFSFVFAALCLSIHFRREEHWRSLALPALVLTILAFLLLGFFGLPDALRGGGEKVFVGVVVMWLFFAGWRLYQFSHAKNR